ncbi:MAG TPA: hypothetical protein VEH06_00625 [Candidatus Bathyarchaeia archaeon]|nr:hypothetical protein [Candidatus Bathyarchaeia archaeon]
MSTIRSEDKKRKRREWPDLLALPPTVKNAFFSPNVSSIHFKNRVFACPAGPTNRICTGSLEVRDLRNVRLIPSYPNILSNICLLSNGLLMNPVSGIEANRSNNI